MNAPKKAHAVFIPCPFQSHIMAMFKLAKLLHHRGFHITFVNTEFNHRRFLKSTSISPHVGDDDDESRSSVNDLPASFRFETIADGLPDPSDDNANQDQQSLVESIKNNLMLEPFLDLLAKLSDPPITCIISDGFMMGLAVRAARQFGLPKVLFFTISASKLMDFIQFRTLREKILAPLQESKKDGISSSEDADVVRDFTKKLAENLSKASAVIIHTFDALEQPALDDLSSVFPNLYAIGPLQFLLLHNQMEQQDSALNSIGYNLWKEETECLKWLDFKEPNSVIYVNFGSAIHLAEQQIVEVGMGLTNSNCPFLWVIRPDLVMGDARALPSEFEDKAKENGFVASWCPQEQVLNHPAVGGFFTHCGWNSVIESVSAGVPMICWPFETDQHMNSRYACNEWEVGMEIGNNGEEVKRDQIEKLVRELMEGENGKKMRDKAMEWRRMAEDAAAPDGSSSRNLDKIVSKLVLCAKDI